MLENIVRHLEMNKPALQAALDGAGEVGFTIVSMTLSLTAVFIPLLFMGGIIGRLFREFAIVVTMTIAVSAFVSLTLTPMMCSRFIRDEKHAKHGRMYMLMERFFDGMLAQYTRGLDFVLRHQFLTLITFFITLATTVALYIVEPKGFFPQQDTGIIAGLADASQEVSFDEMVRLQHKLTDIIQADPDVAGWATGLGGNRPLNNGFVVIGLKPRDERKATAD
jgi:multidrug efflux pump subunit AcrB